VKGRRRRPTSVVSSAEWARETESVLPEDRAVVVALMRDLRLASSLVLAYRSKAPLGKLAIRDLLKALPAAVPAPSKQVPRRRHDSLRHGEQAGER
jgi:hypothetical protein